MLRTIPGASCPLSANTSLGCFSTCRSVAARSRAMPGRSRAVVRVSRRAARVPAYTRSPVPVSLPVFGSAAPAVAGGPRRPRILCYGDSNTVGFCQHGRRYQPYGQALSEALASAWTPCEVTACGLCGLKAKDMDEEIHSAFIEPKTGPSGKGLARLLEDDGPFDLVIIMAGTNDLAALRSSDDTQVHVARLHAVCHEHDIPTVNLAPPSAVSIERFRKERRHLADLMGAWANSTPGVVLHVDTEELMPRSLATLWETDEIHFSARGSNELGQRLASKIAGLLGMTSPTSATRRALSEEPSRVHRVPSPSDNCRSRSPLVRQMMRPVANLKDNERERGSNVIPVDTEKVVERSPVPAKVLPEKRVAETRRAVHHDVLLQDPVLERAVITLQKMQRKRVLHQRIQQEGVVQAKVSERMATTYRPATVMRSGAVTVGKLACSDGATGLLQTASVLTVKSKVNAIGCVV